MSIDNYRVPIRTSMLREASEPFVLCLPKHAEPVLLSDSISENDLKRFPPFAALAVSSSFFRQY
jgi:hypothetical protein